MTNYKVRRWDCCGQVKRRTKGPWWIWCLVIPAMVFIFPIAVLIMAFLGVAMWVAFSTTFNHASSNVDHQVNSCIGQTSSSCP